MPESCIDSKCMYMLNILKSIKTQLAQLLFFLINSRVIHVSMYLQACHSYGNILAKF